MDNDRESAIQMHLQTLVEELERKLAHPKNNWKRREELQSEIEDAKKRLAAVDRGNQRYSSRRSYSPRSNQERSPKPVRSVGW